MQVALEEAREEARRPGREPDLGLPEVLSWRFFAHWSNWPQVSELMFAPFGRYGSAFLFAAITYVACIQGIDSCFDVPSLACVHRLCGIPAFFSAAATSERSIRSS